MSGADVARLVEGLSCLAIALAVIWAAGQIGVAVARERGQTARERLHTEQIRIREEAETEQMRIRQRSSRSPRTPQKTGSDPGST